MKWKIMMTTALAFCGLLEVKELPINGETKSLNLDAAQRQKIVDALGEEMAANCIDGMNSEIKNMAQENLDLKVIQDEIDAMVKLSALTEEELSAVAKDKDGNPDTLALIKAIGVKQEAQAAIIQKLINEPEGDNPLAIISGKNKNVMHTATHLFGSGHSYDAFDGGRSWNARMRDGRATATDFNQSGVIPTLQGDLNHFVEENNGLLSSLFNDFAELPAEWDRRTGVLDRVSDGYIIADEIVQGRAKGWAPKNNFTISAEAGQVWRKKIDITFNGYELQEIENTWIRTYNKNDGSHPWKMSFIGFLLGELIKAQKRDDRNAQINGVWVQSPENVPGRAVNSQNGLRYLWYKYRDIEKKYRAFDIGAPTDANIVDYIEQMILLIPEIDRKEPGMEIQLSSRWFKAYLKRAGDMYPKMYNTDQGKMEYQLKSPIDYPNFIFQELKDATKTDFIGITKSKNVQILDYDASEKGKFTVTHTRRDTDIFADYRLGIRLIYVGTVLEDGDPRAFEMQKVWSNNVPVFDADTYAPAFDIDNSGILKPIFNNIAIDAGWKTNITSVTGVTAGSIVKIKGNTGLAAAKNLVDGNGTLDLVSDFDLSTGATITMFVQPNLKLKEISRTAGPDLAPSTDVNFTTAVLDTKGGNVFKYTGAAATTITSIINGVDGKTIKIYGGAGGADTVTLNDLANVDVASAAVLALATDYVQLTQIAGIWKETARAIV